jgi:hypothetical protein
MTQDLLTNLFKGYQAVNDKTLVSYIGKKLEKYKEGEMITLVELVQLGDNKFKLLKEGGQWNAPSDEEEKILALQLEVKKLQKNTKKVPLKNDKIKTDKSKVKDKTKAKRPEKPPWFFEEPNEADIQKPKFWNNVNWYYCSPKTGGKCDGKYRVHKPSACEGRSHVFQAEKKRKPEEQKDSKQKLKLAKVYETIKEVSSGE